MGSFHHKNQSTQEKTGTCLPKEEHKTNSPSTNKAAIQNKEQ